MTESGGSARRTIATPLCAGTDNRPTQHVCPLHLLAWPAAGVSAVEAFGAELDIGDTGFVQVNKGQVRLLTGAGA